MTPERRAASMPDLAGICVLIVDDDDDARAIMAASLHHAGATVTSAAAGDHALDDLTQFLPDVIVSDLRMPRLDGVGFVARLRARPEDRGGSIPVVGVTAYPEIYRPGEAQALGFAALLPKPLDLDRLGRAVHAAALRAPQPLR